MPKSRRYIISLAVGIALNVSMMAVIAADVALGYDGTCGGLLPFTGEERACTFTEYMGIELPFAFGVYLRHYWYIPLALLALPLSVTRLFKGKGMGQV